MKNGCIGNVGAPSEEELSLINKFTRRTFSADEVYAFSVVLCDNDVDRDFERFSDDALCKMAELFVGKTGIFDHSHKSENQCARIFSCEAQDVPDRKTRLGEPYKRLFARAYTPKSQRSEELILDIDAGIKKEVSVGCSMGSSRCSICGEPFGSCNHIKGRTYKSGGVKKLCYFELSDPRDAYEWSFVAVPAQREAGVVKSYSSEDIEIGGILKSAENGNVTLSGSEAKMLSERIKSLDAIAADAGNFLKCKRDELVKLLMPSANEKICALVGEMLDEMEPARLYKLYKEAQSADDEPRSQLLTHKTKINNDKNKIFMI